MLEEIKHPLVLGDKAEQGLSIRDTARLIYLVSEPKNAGELILNRAIDVFDKVAMAAVGSLEPKVMLEVNEWILKEFSSIGESVSTKPAALPVSETITQP